MQYDKVIIGAGLYGLYAAIFSAKQGDRVAVLEKDAEPFMRATYINQARIHMGYHYPRSYSTAIKSASYFNRFSKDFGYCINSSFDKVYATSAAFSWTDGAEFEKFCRDSSIPCEKLSPEKYFKENMVDGTFLTKEYAYDALILRDHLLKEIAELGDKITIVCNTDIQAIENNGTQYVLRTKNEEYYETPFLFNATYASVNQITSLLGLELFNIKYELCEMIICTVSDALKNTGITVMDGPFFSIMPFGKTGYHSLTSVTFTPHIASHSALPSFSCQEKSDGYCSEKQLGNCNACPAKPASAWPYMSTLARKYLKDEFGFEYSHSLFSMKPILKASEIDDSRPTVIKTFTTDPTFISVLSGKINTVYDIEEVLKNDG